MVYVGTGNRTLLIIWRRVLFPLNLALVTGIAHLLFRDIFKAQKALDTVCGIVLIIVC